ncbi:MAG: YopX family protein [Oscillospiraceae bacterium]|nr:YopX family protein [Oscillospiraceae bacterium]
MCEILFRGQTRRKGEKVTIGGVPVPSNWVYGGIFPQNKGGDFAVIYQQEPNIEKFPVYTDTVGQYTGMKDKHGKKIFEGDILSAHFDESCPEDETRVVVEWNRFSFCTHQSGCDPDIMEEEDNIFWEVIGNIYDNPELMEGNYEDR